MFLTVIILCAVSFASFTILDELFVSDRGLQQLYENALLAITLAAIGVTASRYYGDTTANAALQELKRVESNLEQKIENLESKFDQLHGNIEDN